MICTCPSEIVDVCSLSPIVATWADWHVVRSYCYQVEATNNSRNKNRSRDMRKKDESSGGAVPSALTLRAPLHENNFA